MASKPIIFLGLSLAIFLFMMIASEVTARDLADTTATATTSLANSANEADENKNEIKEAKYPHDGYGGGRYGGGRGGYGGYCRYGCCRRNYYGSGCRRCCAYKGEAMEADEAQAKPHY